MPAYEKKDWILAAIRNNRVMVISGETGCGKSTLVPQLVCDADNLVPPDKVVLCTQPRRVAAITLGEYVAHDRGQQLADEVGYQIRFVNQFSDHTRLIYVHRGIGNALEFIPINQYPNILLRAPCLGENQRCSPSSHHLAEARSRSRNRVRDPRD